MPNVLKALKLTPEMLDVDTAEKLVSDWADKYPLHEKGKDRAIYLILRDLYGIPGKVLDNSTNIGETLKISSDAQLYKYHPNYSGQQLTSGVQSLFSQVVLEDLIKALYTAKLNDGDTPLPITASASQFKKTGGSELTVWHESVARALAGGWGSLTLKKTIYLGLVNMVNLETLHKGELYVMGDNLIPDPMAVVNVVKKRHADYMLDAEGVILPTEDNETYTRWWHHILKATKKLAALSDTACDGASIDMNATQAKQARIFAADVRPKSEGKSMLNIIGKCVYFASADVDAMFKAAGAKRTSGVDVCYPSAVKVDETGAVDDHIVVNGAVYCSEKSNPKDVGGLNSTLANQSLRFDKGDIAVMPFHELGWKKNVQTSFDNWVSGDIGKIRNTMNVKDSSTGVKGMLCDGIQDSLMWLQVQPWLGSLTGESVFKVPVKGSYVYLSPYGCMPIVCKTQFAGEYIKCSPILAPEGCGFKLGQVGLLCRAPTITPGSKLPVVVIGFTPDKTIGIHPLLVKHILRGDFDGDQASFVVMNKRLLPAVKYWMDRVLDNLTAAMNGTVIEPVMNARSELATAQSYAEFCSSVANDMLLGTCDVWCSLLCAKLQNLGLDPAEVYFDVNIGINKTQRLDAYSFFVLLESNTDRYKKRPEYQVFQYGEDFMSAVKTVYVKENGKFVPVATDIRSLWVMRQTFWRKTKRNLMEAGKKALLARAYKLGPNNPHCAIRMVLDYSFGNRWIATREPKEHEHKGSFRCFYQERSKDGELNEANIAEIAALHANAFFPNALMLGAKKVRECLTGEHPSLMLAQANAIVETVGDRASPFDMQRSGLLSDVWTAAAELVTNGHVEKNLFKIGEGTDDRTIQHVFKIHDKIWERMPGTKEYRRSPEEREQLLEDLGSFMEKRNQNGILFMLLASCTIRPRRDRFRAKCGSYIRPFHLLRRIVPNAVWSAIMKAKKYGYESATTEEGKAAYLEFLKVKPFDHTPPPAEPDKVMAKDIN